MAISFGVGLSKLKDSFQAGKEAAEKALSQMGPSTPDLVLAFSSIKFNLPELIKGIRSVTGKSQLIGCTTGGEIDSFGAHTGSVVVAVLKSDKIKIFTSKYEDLSDNPRKGGEEFAKFLTQSISKEEKGIIIIFPDGLAGNMTEVVRGIYDFIGPNKNLIGGGPGDEWRIEKTYQFFNDQVLSDSIVGAYLDSDINIGYGIKHGFKPSGEPLLVTKAQGNILQELNNEPAVNVYLDYFNLSLNEIGLKKLGSMKEANFYPLGIPVLRDEYQIVHVTDRNPDGSIICVNEIPENSIVRIMKTTKEELLEAVREAAEQAVSMVKERKIKAGLIFDCISRPWILEKDNQKEIEIVKEIIGQDIPFAGFYTYGEIGQCSMAEGRPLFHTMTIVICLLAE
ncbi:MAG: FIST signal transduction protein [Candidatus Aminicenantia bacterium]